MDNRIAFLPPLKQRFNRAGYLLGFALGGFFEGILLRQILQWHHFLSGITHPPLDDPRLQLAADGTFLAAMCALAALGLRRLLQARYVLLDRAADRLLAADALIGFGAWQVADGFLAHWLSGLHHVRMDVENPLPWDILWFIVFGVCFLAAGLALRLRRAPTSAGDQDKRRRPRSTQA